MNVQRIPSRSEFASLTAKRRWACAIIVGLYSIQPLPEADATGSSSTQPARAAQCLLEIKGVHYIGGHCLFAPVDRVGSFRVTTDDGIGARVEVRAPEKADVSWSEGIGKTAANPLGSAFSDSAGCWIVEPSLDPTKRTLVCAWDENQKLFLGPTPPDPSTTLVWGERAGMSAQILSSSGLGTEDATLTAIKSRDGAVNWCRQDYDYSTKCIEKTMGDTDLASGKVTLQGNCKTHRFTDFWGRRLEASNGDILDLSTKEKLGHSTAAGSTVAQTAFDALCPGEER